mgnify:CR=1 FL=1
MNVKDLISALQKMPPDAPVWHIWDGAARSQIAHVWLAKSGHVMTIDQQQVVYDDQDRPASAPPSHETRYWQSPRCTGMPDDEQMDEHDPTENHE